VQLEFVGNVAVYAGAAEKIGDAAEGSHDDPFWSELRVAQHGAHAFNELVEAFFGLLELAASSRGELVVFCAAVGLG